MKVNCISVNKVKVSLYLIRHHALKTYGGVGIYLNVMWRIDPLLNSDTVNSGHYQATPATCTQQ
jgi:hypothetical protein